MPIYEIQAPDGEIYEIEGPEGASDGQLISALQQYLQPAEDAGESRLDIARRRQQEYIAALKPTPEEPDFLDQIEEFGKGSSLEKAADFIGDLFSGEDDPRKRDRECRQMAIARYNELLEEAMFDPDEQWALDGFESPRHYARAYSEGTYRLCMD